MILTNGQFEEALEEWIVKIQETEMPILKILEMPAIKEIAKDLSAAIFELGEIDNHLTWWYNLCPDSDGPVSDLNGFAMLITTKGVRLVSEALEKKGSDLKFNDQIAPYRILENLLNRKMRENIRIFKQTPSTNSK